MTDIQDAYEDFCASITDKTEPLPAYKFFEAGYKAGSAAKEEQLKCCGACTWWFLPNYKQCGNWDSAEYNTEVDPDYHCEHFEPRGRG